MFTLKIAGIKAPICAVSGSQYLTTTGWTELRNTIDLDVPFRLFRDEGRTFLQVIHWFSRWCQFKWRFFFHWTTERKIVEWMQFKYLQIPAYGSFKGLQYLHKFNYSPMWRYDQNAATFSWIWIFFILSQFTVARRIGSTV